MELYIIKYHHDGSLFDLGRLNAKTKTLHDLIQKAFFAGDCALVAHGHGDLQIMLNRFSEATKPFGLSSSLGKTEVLHQPAPNTTSPEPAIVIDDIQLKNVESCMYLASVISCDGSLETEMSSRISKASQAFGTLRYRMLHQHDTRLSTKLEVCSAVVLTSLLYWCESWTL